MSAEAASIARPRLVARGSMTAPSAGRAALRRAATIGAETGRVARARATRLNLAAGAIALLVALLHVWTGLRVGTLGYELSRAQDLGRRLDRQLNELDVQNSELLRPDFLADEARRRLGLDWPQSGQVVDLP